MPDEREKIIEEKFVRTEIIEERGQWVVYLEVGDSERSVRHRINAYYKKSLAEIAAKWIKRTAEKEQVFPFDRD
ncbi:MAG: hypothetical protein K1X72_16285 [Pyrinomonadaceae bacterium]|nr:hypothetical protein [Pyrinomonadaceae bacterium]